MLKSFTVLWFMYRINKCVSPTDQPSNYKEGKALTNPKEQQIERILWRATQSPCTIQKYFLYVCVWGAGLFLITVTTAMIDPLMIPPAERDRNHCRTTIKHRDPRCSKNNKGIKYNHICFLLFFGSTLCTYLKSGSVSTSAVYFLTQFTLKQPAKGLQM